MKYFTTNKLTRLVGAIGTALLTAGISSTALAQANWPDRPIKLIVRTHPVDQSMYQVASLQNF